MRARLAEVDLPPERAADLADELTIHLEARHADLVRAGRSEDEAYRIATDELRAGPAWTELCERRPAPEPPRLGEGGAASALAGMWQDVRFGARMLRRHPGFTAAATLTLALGIGANTAIFTVVNAVVLRPLPYADPDRLVNIYETNLARGWTQFSASHPNFVDWRDQAQSFERMAAWRNRRLTAGGAEPESVAGLDVSGGFFPLLGVTPILGRNFLAEEDRPGGPHVALVGEGFWQRRLGGDPAAVGRPIILDDQPYTVVGIVPASFQWSQAEVFVPIAPDPTRPRGDHRLMVMARLRPDITLARATAEMTGIARGLEQTYPETNSGWSVALERIYDDAVPAQTRSALLLLLAAAGLVLLIATTNVANLSLARGAARRREIAIRAALGAQRRRIVRQLLVEALLLALGAGLVGLAVAVAATHVLAASAPPLPRAHELSIDARVVGFALVASVVAGVLFGVVPALHASRPADGRAIVGRVPHRLRGALIVAEVALSLTLLAGAGLLIRSFAALRDVPLGFDPTHVVMMRLDLSPTRYPNLAAASGYYDAVLARLGVEPDVVVAAAGSLPPFSGGGNSSGSLHIDGRVDTPGAALPSADWRIASPGYFRALGIHVRGREFDARDTAAAPRVVIVSEETARRYWPGEDAIGKRVVVKSFGPEPATIVGVVADVPIHRVDAPLRPTVYGPLPAYAVWRPISLVVRTRGEPTTAIAAVRAAVASIDPGVPVADVDTAEDSVSGSLGPRRFPMVLLGAFAGVALALACVGLFGVMAYLVAQRTREIGLRMALGARPGDVFRLIIGHGLALTLAGVAIGLVGAMWLSKLLEGLLYGVAPTDALALAGAAVVLVSVSAAACYVPARRAMRVDPMAALRHE